MVNNFLGNPHKTEYEDIDEDFNMLAEEFVDDPDSSDYEDEDDDFYEDEEEEDDNEDDEEDDEYDEVDYWGDIGFLSDSDSIDIDVPGPPDDSRVEPLETSDLPKDDTTTISNNSGGKEAAPPPTTDSSKNIEEVSSTVHRNLENSPEM